MADDGITINLEGKAYRLDDFELGDLEWLEEYIGRPLSDPGAMNTMKAAVAFVYIIKRRDDPSFSLDDARKVRMTALEDATVQEPKAKRPTQPRG